MVLIMYKREVFNQAKYNYFRKKLRNNSTKSEQVLWYFIRNSQLGYKFRRQQGIGRYIADFYCPKLKLVIEVDGFTHASERVFEKDLEKEKYFLSIGLKIRRYSTEQIFGDVGQVLEDLYWYCENLAGTTPQPPPQ